MKAVTRRDRNSSIVLGGFGPRSRTGRKYLQICLDLIESNNIHGLDEILESGDLVFQIVHHNFIVFNNAGDLQFLDTITKVKL